MSLDFHLLPNLDKVTVSFDKLDNTDVFLQIHGVYLFSNSSKEVIISETWMDGGGMYLC